MKLIKLQRNKIKTNGNPRKSFKGIKELAENIKQVGILVPLVVDNDYKLLNGERRWRASEGILDELPCVEVDSKDWKDPAKRLEIQISIDAMHKRWNVMERASAWKQYVDMGNSERQLATLLGKKNSASVRQVLSLLDVRTSIQNKLAEDDTNWSWHSDAEKTNLPRKQKDNLHNNIIKGNYEDRDDLRESLKVAVDNPELVEKMAQATTPFKRQMVEFNATQKPERFERKFMPKKKTAEEEKEIVEKRVASGCVNALNSINGARLMWERTDAIDCVKKHLNKKELGQVIESIETVVRVWTKTLKELKK